MFKIVTIHDVSDSEGNQEDETITQVTKEAQETIAVSEYVRALSLKQSGKADFALGLFEALLQTQVLSDVPDDDKDNKLFSVKYNCYRNIGLIHEEKGEILEALRYLVQAAELDDSDVYTQCKIGRLSLKRNNLLLAKIAFEKCLERNPNHCGAKDGLLETLCKMEDIDQAYGFALKCYEADRKHERAIRVLKEIRATFLMSLEYYDGIYGRKPEFDDDCKIEYDPNNSVFPPRVEIGFTEENDAKGLPDDFKIPESNLNWITFGKLLLKVYHHLEDNKYSLISCFTWDDWICKPPEFQVPLAPDAELKEGDQVCGGTSGEEGASADDQESETEAGKLSEIKNDDVEAAENENSEQESKKSNNRRRCSDLDYLKEWGWHKNRRSSRKKQKEEEEAVDMTIHGFLKRILPSYFTATFDSNRSPFALESEENKLHDDSEILDHSKTDLEDEEKFYELTKESFEEFMEKFKYRQFDLVIPMFQWLRCVSRYWNQTIIPTEILVLFKKIFKIYEDFVDYHSMYHLAEEDFQSTFRMAMFYYELLFDEFEETKAEIPDEYIRKKDFLQFNIGFVDDDIECTTMLTRLIWLSYRMQIHNNDYKDALGYLYKLEEVYEVPKYSEISVELKNCKHNKIIDEKTIKDLIVKIERKINLASVKKLYETKNYEELVEILRESVIYSTEPKVNIDHLTLKIQTQIEVFLECLWSLNRIPECLEYAEKSLRYAVDNFFLAPTEYRLEEWASLVNYCLVYIDAAIKGEEGCDILFHLDRNLSRLVQSLVQIITHQLDTPAEKNNSKCHLINLNIPWTILYHLVLKEGDIASAKKANEENPPEEEYETMPNFLLMFFTAHEFLGRKQWCTKDHGKMLLFILDILAPIYRTPLLEPYRDVIAEHLEQTTYCLYGYPAKKMKLRHIEEHDAKNVDLTWERAIQLFDLYRPDTLPEFDSYKLQSISSEMEQLLQKILPLIPKCLDISPFTGEIRKFISGTVKTLPKEINILPPKIASIYYLLADFYFKNQETSKAIKFYINDLTMKPDRFDSWASLSLCKQSKLEMKLNGYTPISVKDFLDWADNAINCFQQCLKLKRTITIITEFASFTYHLHSFCSRNLKQCSETLSMETFSAIEERKEKFLNLSFKCFSEVNEAARNPELNSSKNQDESDETHDEKWYYHFMLGKIAEKKKEAPIVYLNHYRKSAQYLYEDNATYPIKINHGNPSHLAIESLEVFYRISACIMKYLEQQDHKKINKPTAKLFQSVLKEMANSPFAFNRAKINKGNINAMKHKLNTTTDSSPAKQAKMEEEVPEKKGEETEPKPAEVSSGIQAPSSEISLDENMELPPVIKPEEVKMEVEDIQNTGAPSEALKEPKTPEPIETDKPLEPPIQPVIKKIIKETDKASRRGSQESAITTTTTTSTRTSSSSDSSADSSSESDSSSSDESDGVDEENVFVSQEVIDSIYKMCIKNLEECVTRFPEHYKSILRLVHHFQNIGGSEQKCKNLLLNSEYETTLKNKINGLFSERKNNNFFNGIWRVPSQEIDRPGNFQNHLSKCVVILMEVLEKTNDHETLLELALHLQRNPETDKKYLNDTDKKELFQQSVTCCVQAFKNKLREIVNSSDDGKGVEILNLMLEVHKSHRKTSKIFQQKDLSQLSGILVEVFKEYIKDRLILPDNANLTDMAFKTCQQELNYRKNKDKMPSTPNPNPPVLVQPSPQQPSATSSPILSVKSISDINKSIMKDPKPTASPSTVKNPTSTPTSSKVSTPQSAGSAPRSKPRSSGSNKAMPTLNPLLSNDTAMQSMLMSMMAGQNSAFMDEYYKTLFGVTASQTMSQMMSSMYPSMSLTTSKTATPSEKKKQSDSLKNIPYGSSNQMLGLHQNLLSNSLSITTTTMTSATSSSPKTSSSSKQQAATLSRKPTGAIPKEPMVSITKSTGDSGKYNSQLASHLNLPDLPKSLSITPSMPSASHKSTRVSDKAKPSKDKSSSSYDRNALLSMGQQESSSFFSPGQSEFHSFIKNYAAQPGLQPATSKKSSPLNVSSASSLLKPVKHKAPSQLVNPSQPKKSHTMQVSGSSSKSAAQMRLLKYDFGESIASSFSSRSMPSPTLPKSPFSHHTPPLAHSPSTTISPTKTLQQKLAERKQQGQTPQKKKDDDDVIVLD